MRLSGPLAGPALPALALALPPLAIADCQSWSANCTPPGRPGRLSAFGRPLELSRGARPTLALIGCAKCGSTRAWHYLAARFGFAQTGKELWCLGRGDREAVRGCYEGAFAGVAPGEPTLDATPTYLFLHHRPGLPSTELAAFFLQYALPETAILVMLRDPVKRVRSEFAYTHNANGATFRKYIGQDINSMVETELAYLHSPEGRGLVDVLLRPLGEAEEPRVWRALGQLAEGFELWLGGSRARCRRVSRLATEEVTRQGVMQSVCRTWPLLIPTLYYPLLLLWRASAFRPGRAAIMQSEAWFSKFSILDRLLPLRPRFSERINRTRPRYFPYTEGGHQLSEANTQRLRDFFELPNLRLRELLRQLSSEGVSVVPPADAAGAWWAS